MVVLTKYKEVREEVESQSSFILITHKDQVLQTNHSIYSLPYFLSCLLQDNENVFPKEIPSVFPFIRCIKLQINFVLSS